MIKKGIINYKSFDCNLQSVINPRGGAKGLGAPTPRGSGPAGRARNPPESGFLPGNKG